MRRTSKAWIFAGVITMAVGIVVLNWYAVRQTQNAAEQFAAAAEALTIGQATKNEVLALVDSAHRRTNGGFAVCQLPTSNSCTGTVYFDNTLLWRLHLRPATIFFCRFDIEHDKLQETWLKMVSVRRGQSEVGVFVHEGFFTSSGEVLPAPQQQFFRITGLPDGYLGVMVTPQTPPELRRAAMGFNFQCLSVFDGCKSQQQMLPVLGRKDLYWGQDPWKHWEGGE